MKTEIHNDDYRDLIDTLALFAEAENRLATIQAEVDQVLIDAIDERRKAFAELQEAKAKAEAALGWPQNLGVKPMNTKTKPQANKLRQNTVATTPVALLVKNLRIMALGPMDTKLARKLMVAAADEIERLQQLPLL